ncbi:neutral cholesterol ester hydrolase 1-like [Mytilus californianus]|uniref:neutral cholesterol ester hydrolase 1-like n=1 Tax=Mytilus californianus TaxID=6549 RepID=UPI00224648B6|nr:neutral cholesterol ester hydrolase 1-like [Mytilus californianus]
MKCLACVLVLPVLMSLLAYRYIQPMPSGAREPRNQMITLGLFRVLDDVISILSSFGYSKTELFKNAFENNPRPEPDPRVLSTDEYFDGIKVRIYRPLASKDKVLPAMVYYHGGGWIYMSVNSYDPLTTAISLKANIVVISVEYRLMPDYIFPSQFEDCLKATEYVFRNAEKYLIDPSRISIGGDSAGGNLAAAVGLKFSQEPKPSLAKIKVQVLLYPVLQAFDFDLPSYREYADVSGVSYLNRVDMINYINMYGFQDQGNLDAISRNKHVSEKTRQTYRSLVDPGLLPEDLQKRGGANPKQSEPNTTLSDAVHDNVINPYAWPLMATDDALLKLPKTYVVVTEYDPLRDEGCRTTKKTCSGKH